jgi:SAM-dependent methyltransferase
VLDAAHLCEGGHHLDVAHGSGDSLLLVLDRTAGPAAYPTQTSITGITSMGAHSQRAKERVAMAKPQDDNESSVRLVCGDAIFRPGSTGSDKHPFAPASKGRYTSIICLDAAYHFVTRHTLLSQAFEALAPGGTLALGDNLSSASYPTSTPTTWALTRAKRQPSAPSPVARLLLPRLLPLLSVPAANIVPLPELAQQLLDLGFEDVAIEDVSEDVWPGFAAFLRQRGLLWRAAGWTIDWLGGSGGLRWVIVRARRPADVVER